ncbi:hypothetical protein I5L01_14230 [Erythrobacter sp. YJ-T3-07]|nr:DUF2231 domain-containing protein [Erythrobacter sp. YJ-T3-07]MBH1945382.1 hypothetical protein [Erythrobacter sp. YJ-T3-07]
MLLFAAVLATGPVYAHGDNAHQSEMTRAAADKNDDGSAAAPATEADDEAAGAHGRASEGSDGAETNRIISFLKTLHPATVHFPIALILTAAFVELVAAMGMVERSEPTVRLLIYAGTIGAIVAASFGWIHTGFWFGGDTTMQLHRWMGMLIAVLGVGLSLITHRDEGGRILLRSGLVVIAVLVIAQGYLGGELAHGPDHLGLSLT